MASITHVQFQMFLLFYRSYFEEAHAPDTSGHFNGILVNEDSIVSGSLDIMDFRVRDKIRKRNQASNAYFYEEDTR